MAALTYNASATLSAGLKKYLKWTSRKSVDRVLELNIPLNTLKNTLKMSFKSLLSRANAMWNLRWQNREFYLVRAN